MHPTFEIKKESEFGRTGVIKTAHGDIQTPAFVFCGTKGALKAQWPHMARATGTQIILSNTYHLLVHPGSQLIDELGGLQKMTAWNGPMMTDSGGYQIFSLGYGSVSQELKGIRSNEKKLVKIKEEGAHFKSYRDGSKIFLSPEKAMQAQIDFGSDLVFVLDECTAFHIKKDKTFYSMQRSHRWEARSIEYFNEHKKPHQGAYGIIQGGIYPEFRKESVEFVNNLDSFGIGIGGSLGKNINDMEDVMKMISQNIRQDKPKHLLGIGTLDAILMAVPYGIDTFDCVYPTRLARHGGALVFDSKNNYLNLHNSKFKRDNSAIDDECECTTCQSFSRAYLHMLLKADESLAQMALTEHNIMFMNRIMSLIRNALEDGSWKDFIYNLNQRRNS